MKLVASVICKNELSRYLVPFIAHLREFCDLICVMDDGSTDGTATWLGDHADEQLTVLYAHSQDFFDGHEGRRRQALLDFTLEQSPSWVVSVDCDEFVSDGPLLREFLNTPRSLGTLAMEEVWKAPPEALHIRMDGGWRPHPVPILWRVEGHDYRIADRALACGREPEQVRQRAARGRPTGVSVLHFGWSKESGRQARYDRYVVADGGRFHKNTHLESIMLPDASVTLNARPWPDALAPFKDQIVRAAI